MCISISIVKNFCWGDTGTSIHRVGNLLPRPLLSHPPPVRIPGSTTAPGPQIIYLTCAHDPKSSHFVLQIFVNTFFTVHQKWRRGRGLNADGGRYLILFLILFGEMYNLIKQIKKSSVFTFQFNMFKCFKHDRQKY